VQSGDAARAVLNAAALKSKAVVTWRLQVRRSRFLEKRAGDRDPSHCLGRLFFKVISDNLAD
jgi:hypothetical protein